jgi:hypothetical protein
MNDQKVLIQTNYKVYCLPESELKEWEFAVPASNISIPSNQDNPMFEKGTFPLISISASNKRVNWEQVKSAIIRGIDDEIFYRRYSEIQNWIY